MAVCVLGDTQHAGLGSLRTRLRLGGVRTYVLGSNDDDEEEEEDGGLSAFKRLSSSFSSYRAMHVVVAVTGGGGGGSSAELLFARHKLLPRLLREAKRSKLPISFVDLWDAEEEDEDEEEVTKFRSRFQSHCLVSAGIKVDSVCRAELWAIPSALLAFPLLQSPHSDSQLGSCFTFTKQSSSLLYAIQRLYLYFSAQCDRRTSVTAIANEVELCQTYQADLPQLFHVLFSQFEDEDVSIVLYNADWCAELSELHRLVSETTTSSLSIELVYSSTSDVEEDGEEPWEEEETLLLDELHLKLVQSWQRGTFPALLRAAAAANDDAVYQLLLLSQPALERCTSVSETRLLLGQQIIGRMAKRFPEHPLVVDAKQQLLQQQEDGLVPLDHFSGLQQAGGAWRRRLGGVSGGSCPVYATCGLRNGMVATCAWDGKVRVFDSLQGVCRQTVTCSQSAALVCMETTSSSSNTLVVGCSDGTLVVLLEDGENEEWSVVRTLLAAHAKQVTCVAVFDDGGFFSGSQDGTIKLWRQSNDDDAEPVQTLRQRDAISSLELVLLEGNGPARLYAGSCDYTVSVYKEEDDEWELVRQFPTGHAGDITAVRFVKQDSLLVTGSLDGMIHVFDASQSGDYARLKQIDCHDQPVQSLEVWCSTLIAGTDRVRAFALPSCVELAVLPDSPAVVTHVRRVLSGGGEQQQQHLAVISQNALVSVFDLAHWLSAPPTPSSTHMITSVCVNSLLAVTTRATDFSLTVWELASGESALLPGGHTDVICAAHLNEQHVLCTGSLDSTCRVWSALRGELLCVVPHSGLVFNCFVSHCVCFFGGEEEEGAHLLVTGSGGGGARGGEEEEDDEEEDYGGGPRFFKAETGEELTLASFEASASIKQFESLFHLPAPVPAPSLLVEELGQAWQQHGQFVYGPVESSFAVWRRMQ